MVYYFQRKGFLNYKLIHFVLLVFSTVFLFGASFLLFHSFDTYIRRLVEIKTVDTDENKIIKNISFGKDEAKIYLDLKENRNTLLGYESFLRETAINYDPSEYSYANVIKAEIMNQFSNKKTTQFYWDEILNSVYTFDSIKHYRSRINYDIMWAFNFEENYRGIDLGEITDLELIQRTSIHEYWNKEIFNTNRDPKYIASFWTENKAYIYTFFSKSKYDDYCKQVVSDLIDIKTKVNQQPNYKEFYENYDVSDAIFLSFPDTTFVDSYNQSWPFSFWDRRYEENNDEVIYSILKEIQNHYKD